MQIDFNILHIFVSPRHNYFGRPKDGPGQHPTFDMAQVEVRRGRGLVGDRYFGVPAHFEAQVTLVAMEVFELVRAEYGLESLSPIVMRRNIVTAGLNLNQLIGEEFILDSGFGPVRLLGTRPCSPCAWMDAVIAPGANRFLKGRGGLRARVLSGGVLARGMTTLLASTDHALTTIADPLPRPTLPG